MKVRDIWIPSTRLPGLDIHVRSKCKHQSGVPLLLLHGTTLPPQLNYDMPFDGQSAADLIVDQGPDCYMVSALGYGLSGKPVELLYEPAAGSVGSYDDWVHDITDVMGYLGFDSYDVLAWSGSAIPSLMLAAQSKIRKLIIYGITSFTPKAHHESENVTYIYFDHGKMHYRRYRDIPISRREEILPAAWYDSWVAALDEAMPIKVPQGTENDRRDIRAGRATLDQWLDINKVQCDLLFLTGAWDRDVDMDYFHSLFRLIPAKNKRFRLSKDGSHWALMETKRMNIINIMTGFLQDR